MIYLGLAGMVNWTIAIPIDTIKSRIQASQSPIGQVIKDLYQQGGIKSFFRGLTPTLLRAFPASAALFGGVELSKKALDKIL